jgi:hypothetical protein
MSPLRPIHLKEKDVYELSSDEDFLLSHTVKASIIFHLSYILFHGCKLTFAMVGIGMFPLNSGILELSRFCYK